MARMMAEDPNNVTVRTNHQVKDQKCSEKAFNKGQLTFTLIEQDKSSPLVIADWIKQNIMTAPASKLYDAIEIAVAMRESEIVKKNAD